MAPALPFIQGFAAVMGAIGALNQGGSQASMYQYNAAINQQNAMLAQQQSERDAKQQQRETYQRLGAVAAAQGKAGGAAGEGSVLDVLGDVAAQSELERQDILYRGNLAARGYQNTANLDSFSARNARSGSFLRAGSELLSGGFGAYSTYNRLKRTGSAGAGLGSTDSAVSGFYG